MTKGKENEWSFLLLRKAKFLTFPFSSFYLEKLVPLNSKRSLPLSTAYPHGRGYKSHRRNENEISISFFERDESIFTAWSITDRAAPSSREYNEGRRATNCRQLTRSRLELCPTNFVPRLSNHFHLRPALCIVLSFLFSSNYSFNP